MFEHQLFRLADNIQTRLVDWLTQHRSKQKPAKECSEFHKMNLTRFEFKKLFEDAGFTIKSIVPVENMPILYKFSILELLIIRL